MKPILKIIQKTIVESFQKEALFQKLTIISETFDPLESLTKNSKTLAPLKLYVSIPFPLEIAANISQLCWEKLSLQCTLIRNHLSVEKDSFHDLAEQICYFISHKNFVHDQWEGCFVLETKNPWKWLDLENGIALQMNFITSQFSLLL